MTKHEIKVLTKLLHDYCLQRDFDECLKCGKTTTLCASHIYPKGTHRKMRFNPENVKTLCYRCHIHWWHKSPIEANEWLKTVIDENRLKRLKMQANYQGNSPMDYNLIKLELEQLIKNGNQE